MRLHKKKKKEEEKLQSQKGSMCLFIPTLNRDPRVEGMDAKNANMLSNLHITIL